MTEEEKEAIKILEIIKVCGDKGYIYNFEAGIILNLIQKQQEAIEKKDKIIDGMARSIANYDSQLVINRFKDKEHVKEFYKEYFEKEKVQKMSWELHKKKDKKLYAIYSTVIDDYITEFEDKEDIEDFLIKTYTGKAYIKAKEFMKEVNKEV